MLYRSQYIMHAASSAYAIHVSTERCECVPLLLLLLLLLFLQNFCMLLCESSLSATGAYSVYATALTLLTLLLL